MTSRWRFAWAWFVGAVLLMVSCSGINIPHPNPTPKPPPVVTPSPVCAEGQTHSCYHNPGEGWLYACPVYDAFGGIVGVQNEKDPGACPAKPGTPPPPPPPPPPPSQGCVLAGEPTETITGYAHEFGSQLNEAIHSLYPACDIGSRCVIKERPQAFQAAVEIKLRAMGLCAGQHAPGTDEIAVAKKAGSPWEGFHIYAGDGWDNPNGDGTIVWAPQAKRPVYKAPGTVSPPPPPPVTDACGEPVPPPLTDFNLTIHLGRRWPFDGTASVHGCGYKGPGTNFCRDIGLPTMPNNPAVERCDCPAGNESDGAKRSACERKVIGEPGPPANALWRGNGTVEVNPDNHLLAACSGCTWIEVCKADGTKCTRVTL